MTESTAPAADAAPAPAAPAAAAPRPWVRHKRKTPLSVTPRPLTVRPSLYDKALDVIAPWRRADYPGRQRAWIQVAGHLPWILRDVRQGRHGYDAAILDRLDTFLTARLETLALTLDAVRAESARLKAAAPKRVGLCIVDPITGTDKRYRGSKSRKK